jgi:TATA-binding protein-associated factor
MVAGLVIVEWARLDTLTLECPEALRTRLHQCLCECVYFDEIALSFTRLLQEARDFVAMLKHYKLPLDYETYGTVGKVTALPLCLTLLTTVRVLNSSQLPGRGHLIRFIGECNI